MSPKLNQLLPAIVSYVTDKGGYVTKTKLLKLLYLFDVEYYRDFRKTYTGFGWKFFHLGPWVADYDPLLASLISSGDLEERSAWRPEYDTKFFATPEPVDFGNLFPSVREEMVLRRVLNLWAEESTGEILNHVYFHTEPMEHGVRNELLDFSVPRRNADEI